MNLQPIEERNRAKTLLTPREYQIWNHHHNHGHSQRNIADALNLTRDTIRTYLTRAERKLQCPPPPPKQAADNQ